MSVPPFNPDSSLVHDVVLSPNHGARVGDRLPDMILLHYTGMPESQGALEWICSPQSKVSAHYYVFEDGRIIQMVPEALRAWHAGESFWANDTDINSCSIGIEIANPGHDHKYPDFPARQIAAVTALCRSIIKRRLIPAERVLAHSDVAPGRKSDPGEKFPWRILHNSGVGHWVEPLPIVPGPDFTIGDRGDVIASFQLLLARIWLPRSDRRRVRRGDARRGHRVSAPFPARARRRRGRFLDPDDAAGADRFTPQAQAGAAKAELALDEDLFRP